jgi:acyl dehydratase
MMAQLLQSPPLRIEKSLLRAYAEVTDDWNPLHLDEKFAAATPLGGIIAHGTLSLNLVSRLVADCMGKEMLNGAVLDVRFISPVRLGDVVTGCARAAEGASDTFDVWVETADEKRVIEGTLVVSQAGTVHKG